VSSPTTAVDLQNELVAASRERMTLRLSSRERLTHGTTAILFVAASATLALANATPHQVNWALIALFVGTIGLASRIELEVASGFTVPVELVIIPMLFALPPGVVPAAVGAGFVVGQMPSYLRGEVPSQRIVVAIGNASSTLAPAVVFLAFYDAKAGAAQAVAVTAVAVLAQFAFDAAISTLREHFAVGVDMRALMRGLAWIFLVDACLAPVGLAAGLAGSQWAPAYLLPLPLLLLTRMFARERADRVSQALELSAAYRGTAFLLGDVVEADDAYTGAHSRDVVQLSVSVADQLGLDARFRQLTELTALLHDVGKISIPNEIINKQGPLDREERAIINTHTIEGERLLSKVGGLLREVGKIVRSCHERYDGGGYPDGLAGEEIPMVARIVCCCDAFNAMTTTRSYRAAMTPTQARAELVANRGSQFDPDVVDAILTVTRP
jgi:HD-GYP domain-containing protein (c-di-GMP phosphodiesterase class II)